MKFRFRMSVRDYKRVPKAVQEATREVGFESVKAYLDHVLRPVSEGGLPSKTGRARASFEAIARKYGRDDAGPYDYNEAFSRYHETGVDDGESNPVTDNGAFDRPASKYAWWLKIPISNNGFPYFMLHDYGELKAALPPDGKAMIPTPWHLTAGAMPVQRDYIRANIQKRVRKAIKLTLRSERIRG